MSFYVAVIIVLTVTALVVLACLAAAWVLAGNSWHDETVACPRCGEAMTGAGNSCPQCKYRA